MTSTSYLPLLAAAALSLFLATTCSADIPIAFGTNAPEAPLHERVLSVPGDAAEPAMLQVTLLEPSGKGPFPLAVVNHGSTSGVLPRDQPRYRFTFAAYYFLSRGYAVALPMMRGYAGSEGILRRHGCDDEALGHDAAKDISAVVGYIKRMPEMDGHSIVVAGQSFGGWNTLVLGSLQEPDVKGLINFAGGMIASDCDRPAESLIRAASHLGSRTTVPSIWFYGDNDSLFDTSTWRGMFAAYTAAGADAEIVAYGRFMNDSHNMLGSGEGLKIWVPKVDAFLARIGMPHTVVQPEYMPIETPSPSHYAKVEDVDAVPYSNSEVRAAYQSFLAKPLSRAFALSPTRVTMASGGFDPSARALEMCEQTGPNCRLYAVDNDVVWVRPTPEPPPTHIALLEDSLAVPYLNSEGRAGYRGFLHMRRPRAFAISSDGSWDAASLGPDPLAYALTKCRTSHPDCELYAVDNDVVWSQARIEKSVNKKP